MKKTFLLSFSFVSLLLFSYGCSGVSTSTQGSVLHQDFENPRPDGRAAISYAGGGGSQGAEIRDYSAGLDSSTAHSGKYSLKLTYRQGKGGMTRQDVDDVSELRGKTVQITAWVKTQNIAEAGLWLRADGKNDKVLDIINSTPISGTNDWTLLSDKMFIPANTEYIAYGVTVRAPGDAWIDDILVAPLTE